MVLSPFERGEIIGLHKLGISNRAIAETLHFSRRTVDGIVAQYLETGTTSPKKSSGRPRSLKNNELGIMVEESKKKPELTATEIAMDEELNPYNVSSRTIQRRLKEQG